MHISTRDCPRRSATISVSNAEMAKIAGRGVFLIIMKQQCGALLFRHLLLFTIASALTVLGTSCAFVASIPSPSTPPSTKIKASPGVDGAVPNFSHVFVIAMENKEYGNIIGSPSAPYINRIARTYASATQYYAVTHPSLPNYLALISGSTQGMTTDCANCAFNAPNLVDQLEVAHKTWTAYAEDLPRACFNGTSAGNPLPGIPFASALGDGYVRRHNPFMYFNDISQNPNRCQHVVPLSRFANDMRSNNLSDFVWITPNLRHDMHNGTIEDGDAWLASFVPAILKSADWKHGGVLFIVWDEGTTNAGCCGNARGGRVPALVIAATGKRHYQSNIPYTHYSVLRTIEDSWHLPHLGHAGDPSTSNFSDFFP